MFLPVQDVFGWRDRINMPGTVGDEQLDVAAAVAGRPARRTCRTAAERARVLPGAGGRAPAAHDRLEWRATLSSSTDAIRRHYLIREYPLQQGALEIAYIEEFFNEFPERKTAAEIMQRLEGREYQILMAEAPLPDDPTTVVPVSYKVSHELRADETDPKLVDLVERLARRRRVRRPQDSLQLARRDAAATGAARATSAR